MLFENILIGIPITKIEGNRKKEIDEWPETNNLIGNIAMYINCLIL